MDGAVRSTTARLDGRLAPDAEERGPNLSPTAAVRHLGSAGPFGDILGELGRTGAVEPDEQAIQIHRRAAVAAGLLAKSGEHWVRLGVQ